MYGLIARKVIHHKERKANNAMEKQKNDEPVDPLDRIACGERPILTVEKMVSGHTNDHIPTQEERETMTTGDRVKSGETLRNIGITTVTSKKREGIAKAYEKQEQGKDLSTMDRLRMGERPLVAGYKEARGRGNEHIPTQEEREAMTTFERIKSGERIQNIVKEREPIAI